jgi:hypothetical protein
MIGEDTAVDITITKWDLVADTESKAEIVQFLASVATRAEVFSGRVAALRWHQTAALPTRNSTPLGFGVDALVRAWMQSSYLLPRHPKRSNLVVPPEAREYLRFAKRHFEQYAIRRAEPAVQPETHNF